MDCRSCGVDLPRDAVYCLRCGARVELGSVLGVGTELPPAVVQPVAVPQPPSRPDQPEKPTSATSRGTVLAMVATFIVLTVIGTFALTRIFGSDAPQTSASLTSTPEASEEGEPTPSVTPSSPGVTPSTTPPPSPSPSATPTQSGASIPDGARRCSTNGSDAVATAYAATERTSCEFAASVREAYRKAGTPEGTTTLRAYSPVTKKWYSLSCDGGAPVRCTSTTNAVVLLAP